MSGKDVFAKAAQAVSTEQQQFDRAVAIARVEEERAGARTSQGMELMIADTGIDPRVQIQKQAQNLAPAEAARHQGYGTVQKGEELEGLPSSGEGLGAGVTGSKGVGGIPRAVSTTEQQQRQIIQHLQRQLQHQGGGTSAQGGAGTGTATLNEGLPPGSLPEAPGLAPMSGEFEPPAAAAPQSSPHSALLSQTSLSELLLVKLGGGGASGQIEGGARSGGADDGDDGGDVGGGLGKDLGLEIEPREELEPGSIEELEDEAGLGTGGTAEGTAVPEATAHAVPITVPSSVVLPNVVLQSVGGEGDEEIPRTEQDQMSHGGEPDQHQKIHSSDKDQDQDQGQGQFSDRTAVTNIVSF